MSPSSVASEKGKEPSSRAPACAALLTHRLPIELWLDLTPRKKFPIQVGHEFAMAATWTYISQGSSPSTVILAVIRTLVSPLSAKILTLDA